MNVTWDEGGDAGKTAIPKLFNYSVAVASLRSGPSRIRTVEGGISKGKPPFCFHPFFSFAYCSSVNWRKIPPRPTSTP